MSLLMVARQRLRLLPARSTVAFVLLACAAVLIPWTFHLGQSLPSVVAGHHVRSFWVTYDILLIVGLAGTAGLTLTGRKAAAGIAVVTALLLIFDAFLDSAWAPPDWHVAMALARAVFVEFPIAALLLYVARLTSSRT